MARTLGSVSASKSDRHSSNLCLAAALEAHLDVHLFGKEAAASSNLAGSSLALVAKRQTHQLEGLAVNLTMLVQVQPGAFILRR